MMDPLERIQELEAELAKFVAEDDIFDDDDESPTYGTYITIYRKNP